MKTVSEKEKKLNTALSKLTTLNLKLLICLMQYPVFFLFHSQFSYIYIIKLNLLSLDRIIFEQAT